MIEKRRELIINVMYFAIIALLTVYVITFSFNYLAPFIFGFVIAFLLKPVVFKLTKTFGEKKSLSLLVIVLFYIVVGFLLVWLFLKGVHLIAALAETLPAFYSNTIQPVMISFLNWFEAVIDSLDPGFSDQVLPMLDSAVASITTFLPKFATSVAAYLTGFVAKVPSMLITILIAIISSFFFTTDYRNIVNSLLGFLPERQQVLVIDVKNGLIAVFTKYIKAYAILMSVTFVELSIAFWILRVPNPFGLALTIAMVDILPVLGTGSIMIPWTILEVTVGNRQLGFALGIIYVAITIVRNILEPKVLGKQIGLHPLLTLACIYVGLKLFGFVGLIGLPMAATLIKNLHEAGKINIFRKHSSPALLNEE